MNLTSAPPEQPLTVCLLTPRPSSAQARTQDSFQRFFCLMKGCQLNSLPSLLKTDDCFEERNILGGAAPVSITAASCVKAFALNSSVLNIVLVVFLSKWRKTDLDSLSCGYLTSPRNSIFIQ